MMSNCSHHITVVDPKFNDNDPLEAVQDADGVIVCVPHPCPQRQL